MAGQFVVIGIGNFGFHVAKALYEKGNEVICVDKNRDVIQKIRDFATEAIVADTTDKEVLDSLDIKNVDVVIVCLGKEVEASILTTYYLKELGAKYIVAKANSEDHRKILEKIGATETVFPEKDIAIKVAQSLCTPNIIEHLPLSKGYSIVELAPPKSFLGKSIRELRLRNVYGVQVIAVKETISDNMIMIPDPDFVIKDSDALIIMGKDEDIERIKKIA